MSKRYALESQVSICNDRVNIRWKKMERVGIEKGIGEIGILDGRDLNSRMCPV